MKENIFKNRCSQKKRKKEKKKNPHVSQVSQGYESPKW